MLLSKDLFIAHSWEPLLDASGHLDLAGFKKARFSHPENTYMDPMGFPMEKLRNIFQADLVFYPKGTAFFFSFFFVGRFKRNDDSAKKGVETNQLLAFFCFHKSLDFGGPSCIAPSTGGAMLNEQVFSTMLCHVIFAKV